MQAVLQSPEASSILQYGQNAGYLPLRSMLAAEHDVSEDQVLIGNGSLHLQDLLAAVIVRPGDVVLVESPSYDRAITTFRRRGATVIGIPLEQDGLSLAVLEQAIKYRTPAFVYVIPDFQNPAGVTTSLEKRQSLVALAERHDFFLVEDVPYRSLRYSGEPVPLLREIGPHRVLTLSSYSKLISPALRVGYLIGPGAYVERIRRLTEDTILMPVLPSQAAVFAFHERGYFTPHLERLKRLYARRLQTIVAALGRYLPALSFVAPEGGFFVGITLPQEVDCTGLLARARRLGLILTDGRGFFADPFDQLRGDGQPGGRFLRLPFCALSPAQIEEGIERLAQVVEA
jgi:2-aminoadipate transaminase